MTQLKRTCPSWSACCGCTNPAIRWAASRSSGCLGLRTSVQNRPKMSGGHAGLLLTRAHAPIQAMQSLTLHQSFCEPLPGSAQAVGEGGQAASGDDRALRGEERNPDGAEAQGTASCHAFGNSHPRCCQHAPPATWAVQVPTTSEMVAQVRQGQATMFQVAYTWLTARLGTRLCQPVCCQVPPLIITRRVPQLCCSLAAGLI